MSEPNELEKRIVDLELRYMRAEKMLQDLSDVIVEQGRVIQRLTTEVTGLRERLPEASPGLPIERPPHY